MTTESTLQRRIMNYARKLGCLAYKFGSPGQAGVPDLLIILPYGRVIFIEVKSPKGTGRLSELQRVTFEHMRAQGAVVYVVDSYKQACEELDFECDYYR